MLRTVFIVGIVQNLHLWPLQCIHFDFMQIKIMLTVTSSESEASGKAARRLGNKTSTCISQARVCFYIFIFQWWNANLDNAGHSNGYFLPSLSSPKFPHPIFLPTLKLGPTIRTPEDADELGREPCPLLPGIPFVVRCLSSFSLLGWSMILVKYLCQQAGRKELEYALFSLG